LDHGQSFEAGQAVECVQQYVSQRHYIMCGRSWQDQFSMQHNSRLRYAVSPVDVWLGVLTQAPKPIAAGRRDAGQWVNAVMGSKPGGMLKNL
jgi:hypothetical protein